MVFFFLIMLIVFLRRNRFLGMHATQTTVRATLTLSELSPIFLSRD